MPTETTIGEILTKLTVDIAVVKEKAQVTQESVARIELRMADAMFREEYERRHKALEDAVYSAARRAEVAEQRSRDIETAGRVWRYAFSTALGTLGLIIVYFHH